MGRRARKYWLMKSEPSVYSISDLERDRKTMWDGVHNYQARNLMRDDMAPGDLALFYHSNDEPIGVAGVMRICGDAYPDPGDATWIWRDVEHVETFADIVPLSRLKADAKLDGMMVIKRGMRLSVQPVDKRHFARVLRLAGARTKP